MLTAIIAGAETLTGHSNMGFLFQCNSGLSCGCYSSHLKQK